MIGFAPGAVIGFASAAVIVAIAVAGALVGAWMERSSR